MVIRVGIGSTLLLAAALVWAVDQPESATGETTPYLVVLGVAQDGGVPQAGTKEHPGWSDPTHSRLATSLALVDPVSQQRWIFDATPDFREQLHRLDVMAPAEGKPGLDGIFLTHAHMGHYTGLMHLGHEAMGAKGVPVYAMPRMREYLRDNGPWSQLVATRTSSSSRWKTARPSAERAALRHALPGAAPSGVLRGGGIPIEGPDAPSSTFPISTAGRNGTRWAPASRR